MFGNGTHDGKATTEDTEWTFTCDTGYHLLGSSGITCGSDRQWSDSVPRCGKYFMYF